MLKKDTLAYFVSENINHLKKSLTKKNISISENYLTEALIKSCTDEKKVLFTKKEICELLEIHMPEVKYLIEKKEMTLSKRYVHYSEFVENFAKPHMFKYLNNKDEL
ncbi:MAG: hypothetical protein ACRCZI_15795 [Cetobacterium sp.]